MAADLMYSVPCPLQRGEMAPPWKDSRVQAIAQEWRENCVLSGCEWSQARNQIGSARKGESGGMPVTSNRYSGRRAHMKPWSSNRSRGCRAPREKIASDLAYDLGVPVPPVVLSKRPRAAHDGEMFTCVSLYVYAAGFPWEVVRDNLAAGKAEVSTWVVPHLPSAAAVGLAFDTWLDQRDHGDTTSNILFGYDQADYSQAGFVFIDYAFSMGMTGQEPAWVDGGHLLCRHVPFPSMMLERMDRGALEDAIKRIETYPDNCLEEIVSRIPGDYFQPQERESILAGLRDRKLHLRSFVSSRLTAEGDRS